MEIKTREINGVNCEKEKRYLEVTFKHDDTNVNCGFLDYKERCELASHLSEVVDDLLYNLEDVE